MERGYNLRQVSEALGVKVRTVRHWIYNDKIKAAKIPGSRRWIVMESEIRRLQGEDENKYNS